MTRGLIALLLLVVGIGNIVFGSAKLEEYQLLFTAEQALERGQPERPSPLMSALPAHLPQKHQNRIEFYKLTIFGGMLLLILGVGVLGSAVPALNGKTGLRRGHT